MREVRQGKRINFSFIFFFLLLSLIYAFFLYIQSHDISTMLFLPEKQHTQNPPWTPQKSKVNTWSLSIVIHEIWTAISKLWCLSELLQKSTYRPKGKKKTKLKRKKAVARTTAPQAKNALGSGQGCVLSPQFTWGLKRSSVVLSKPQDREQIPRAALPRECDRTARGTLISTACSVLLWTSLGLQSIGFIAPKLPRPACACYLWRRKIKQKF